MKRNSSRESKGRINVWLEKSTLENLRAEARGRGAPLQALIESAVAAAYGPELREKRNELILRRLNLLDRQVQVVERMIEVETEGFVTFLRIYLGTTSRVPESQFEATRRRCEEAYQSYLKALAMRLTSGPSFFEDLPEGVVFGVGGVDRSKNEETFPNSDRTRSDLPGGGPLHVQE